MSICLCAWQFMRSAANSDNAVESIAALETIITQPIASLLRNDSFNDVVLAILFGLVGLVCYTIIEVLMGVFHSYKNQKTLVHFEGKNVVTSIRPGAKVLLGDWPWRLAVIVGLIVFTFLSMLVFNVISSSNFLAKQPGFVHFAVIVFMYMLVLHMYLVFLRLYIRRTRIFEELLF